jgi:hypothetical protein
VSNGERPNIPMTWSIFKEGVDSAVNGPDEIRMENLNLLFWKLSLDKLFAFSGIGIAAQADYALFEVCSQWEPIGIARASPKD